MMLAFFCGYFYARRREASQRASLAPAYRGH